MPDVLRVAVPLPLPELFDYLAPPGSPAAALVPGARVTVPFGPRTLMGVVVAHAKAPANPKLRAISAVFDPAPVFPEPLWKTLLWAARYYAYPLGEALATVQEPRKPIFTPRKITERSTPAPVARAT